MSFLFSDSRKNLINIMLNNIGTTAYPAFTCPLFAITYPAPIKVNIVNMLSANVRGLKKDNLCYP